MAKPSVIAACWVGQNPSPFFAVSRSKFTKLSMQVWERSQFAAPFSVWRFLVFWRYLQSSREEAEIYVFWTINVWTGPQIMGRDPKFLTILGHHRTCSKVWWLSTKWHRTLGSEKRKKEDCTYLLLTYLLTVTSAAKHNGWRDQQLLGGRNKQSQNR